MSDEEREPEDADVSGRTMLILLTVVVEGGLVGLAWLMGWFMNQPPLRRLTFDFWGLLWGVVAALPLLAAFALMMRWPVGPFKRIKDFTEKILRSMLAPLTVLDMLCMSLLAGLGEEMLFRGVMQDVFARWAPTWLAIVVVGLLFGMMHAMTATYALIASLMGMFLGWVYAMTDNLLSAVIAHALYDFVVLVWILRGPGSKEDGETPGSDDSETP